MTFSVVGHAYKRLLPYTLAFRLLSLTTAPSLAAILQVNTAYAAHPATVIAEEFKIDDLLAATNAAREAQGLPDLVLNPELTSAAAAKVTDMRTVGYWDHFRPSDHKAPWDFITEAGYDYHYAGENLARGFQTVGGITQAWLASPAHRANLLSPKYTEVGFADALVTQPDGTTVAYTVQMFGSR